MKIRYEDDRTRTIREFILCPKTMCMNKNAWDNCDDDEVLTTKKFGFYTYVQVLDWVENNCEDGCMSENWVDAYWVD